MRKLKLQMQLSVDGFVGGPNGELDWMVWNYDDDLNEYINKLTNSIDCILMGRKMTDGFVNHWESVLDKPDDPSYEFAKKMCDTLKVVFTKSQTESTWNNTNLATGDLIDEVNHIKKQDGKDIIVYGGAELVSNLIQNKLIDEFHLFINPTTIGKGLSIFKERTNMKLIDSRSFECGIVLLKYELLKS